MNKRRNRGYVNFGNQQARDHAKIVPIGVLHSRYTHIGTNDDESLSKSQSRDGRFYNVPFLAVDGFVDRPALYEQLQNYLQVQPDTPLQNARVAIVEGNGGTGKTQLVLNYIKRHESEYRGIFWLSLADKQSVEQEVLLIYRYLLDPEHKEKTPPAFGEAIILVKNWFRKQESGQWLWILDNADNVEDPHDPSFIDLALLIPQAPCVQTIVTTRCTEVADVSGHCRVQVESMTSSQALDLFYSSTKINPIYTSESNLQTAKVIVEELGNHALAVTTCGAAISKSRKMTSDLKEWLALYNENKARLLSQQPRILSTRYSESVFSSWETSFQLVERRYKLAARLLGLVSLLSPNRISLDFFQLMLDLISMDIHTENEADWKEALTEDFESIDMDQIEAALDTLQSFSLLKYDELSQVYVMHKLVQAWGFERLPLACQLRLGRVMTSLLTPFSEICCEVTPALRSMFMTQMTESFRILSSSIFHREECTSRLFLRQWTLLGRLALDAGFLETCATVRRFVLAKSKELIGTTQGDTIKAMLDLAHVFQKQGHVKGSSALRQQVLDMSKLTLGMDHPVTLAAIHQHGLSLLSAGQVGEAAAMFKDASKRRARVLGEDHSCTLHSKQAYANARMRQGDFENVEEVFQEVIDKRQKIYGKDHPKILFAIGKLCNLYYRLGKLEQAEGLLKDLLKKQDQILGIGHQKSIIRRIQLSAVLWQSSKTDEAIELLQEVSELAESGLGSEHPHTLRARYDLAYFQLGRALGSSAQESSETASLIESLKETIQVAQRVLPVQNSDRVYMEQWYIQAKERALTKAPTGSDE